MKKSALFICSDANRADEQFGKAYSILLDSISDELIELGIRVIHVSMPRNKLVGDKTWSNVISFENASQRRYFKKKVILIIISIFNFLGFKSINILKEKWYVIFKKFKPSVIFTINCDEKICFVSNYLKIPVVEVIHGIGYVDIPWGLESRTSNNLPNYFLCFDNLSYKTFSKMNYKKCKSILAPHPWYKKYNKLINLRNEFIRKIELIFNSNIKIILVSLQWGYDGEIKEFNNIIENGLFPQELISIIKKLKSSHYFLFRRHPIQIRHSKYDYQIDYLQKNLSNLDNCDFLESSKTSLINLIPFLSGHITLSSMTSYDVSLFGIQTLFLCPTLLENGFNRQLFEDLVCKKIAIKETIEEHKIMQHIVNFTRMHPNIICDAGEVEWLNFINLLFAEFN